MASKERFFEAADALRAEGVRVSYRSVNERLKRGGVGCSNDDVKPWLREWNESRRYNSVIELAGLPDAVSTRLTVAAKGLWEAAQAEAAAMQASERRRMEDAVQAERELHDEVMGMLEAREAVIAAQRDEIAWYAAELEREKARIDAELDRMREHVAISRAREFWRRVVQEIWEILPDDGTMHVNEITGRIGADLVQEAEEHRQTWNVDTVRGAIDERRYKHRLFVWEGYGRYRRRRPEDAAA